MFDDEDLEFMVESNEDDTEIALVVRSPSGRKIEQRDFIVMLEMYLNDVTNAEVFRMHNGSSIH